jgi:uncharacterized protein YeaO (DUF488 family)
VAVPVVCLAATPAHPAAQMGKLVSSGNDTRMTDIRVRRVYEDPMEPDGARVLVDRIWPRGLRKEAAHIDHWAKDAAPSTELRTWFGHDPAKFDEFRKRYNAELAAPKAREELDQLRALATRGRVTLLTATKEPSISQAAVLADLLRHMSA